MSIIRVQRTINAMENGNYAEGTGETLESRLTDEGHLAEFVSMLSLRGETRRISSNVTSMTAVNSSAKATDAIFAAASSENSTACQAVVASAVAMQNTSLNISTLQKVGNNSIAWSLFSKSDHYQTYLPAIVSNLAGISVAAFVDIETIVSDATAKGAVVDSNLAMSAMVADTPATQLMVDDHGFMGLVAARPAAINVVANSSQMDVVAGSPVAMTEITAEIGGSAAMANSPGAIQAIANVPTSWQTYKNGAHFALTLKSAIINIAGLSGSYPTIDSIIADPVALALVAANAQASDALSTSSAAAVTLSTSPNLGIILGSATAMVYFGTESVITTFLGVEAAVPVVFGSSIAKGVIVASTPLVDLIAGSSSIVSFLSASAVTSIPASLRSATTAANDPFDGIPSKVLTLGMRANNIGAISANYNFGGSPAAGTGATATIGLKGSVTNTHIFGYTNPTWTVAGIAVTAAVSPEWTWYDMT